MVLKIPFFCSSGTIIIISQNSNCIIDFRSADSIKLAKVSVTIGVGGGSSITKLQIPKRRQRIKGFQSPIKKANFRVTLLYICPIPLYITGQLKWKKVWNEYLVKLSENFWKILSLSNSNFSDWKIKIKEKYKLWIVFDKVLQWVQYLYENFKLNLSFWSQ